MFNESNKNNYTITYDSWFTERKQPTDGNELQADIGSAQHVNSPKYLIGAFQTSDSCRNKESSFSTNNEKYFKINTRR